MPLPNEQAEVTDVSVMPQYSVAFKRSGAARS